MRSQWPFFGVTRTAATFQFRLLSEYDNPMAEQTGSTEPGEGVSVPCRTLWAPGR